MSDTPFTAPMARLNVLTAALAQRLAEISAEIAEHRIFMEQALNITRYEEQIRIAEQRTRAEQLGEIEAELKQVSIERRRLERRMVQAGYPISSNDNANGAA